MLIDQATARNVSRAIKEASIIAHFGKRHHQLGLGGKIA
jgi:hypothetical protein